MTDSVSTPDSDGFTMVVARLGTVDRTGQQIRSCTVAQHLPIYHNDIEVDSATNPTFHWFPDGTAAVTATTTWTPPCATTPDPVYERGYVTLHDNNGTVELHNVHIVAVTQNR